MTPDLLALLKLMGDHRFHSGENLGQQLGVGRGAVWKRVSQLRELGLEIESQAGQGYRLLSRVEPLNEQWIKDQLSAESDKLLKYLEILPEVDSTNLYLMRNLHRLPSGSACLAEYQSGGRGRNGRHWISPYGNNIYLSLLWHYQNGAASLSGLSLALALAVVESLQTLDVEGLTIKWPNDVLLNGRKLAGLLVEIQGDAAGELQIVAGVGVNVRIGASAAGKIDQPWAQLAHADQPIRRNQLAALLIEHLLLALELFTKKGFSGFSERWTQWDALSGSEVMIQGLNEIITGTVLGVDGLGRLRLDTTQGEQLISGGEVSVRKA